MGIGRNMFGTHLIHLPKLNGKCTSITITGIGHGEHKLRMVRVLLLREPPKPESVREIKSR